MKWKIATKYTFSIVAVIIVVTLIFVPIYITVQKQGYINMEIREMEAFGTKLVESVDFSDRSALKEYIEEKNEKNYLIDLYNENKVLVYHSGLHSRKNNVSEKKDMFFEKFSLNQKPFYVELGDGGQAAVSLRRKVISHKQTFYLFIDERLHGLQSVFDYTNQMVVFILILHILACGIAVFWVMRSLTKSIRSLNDAVKKLSCKDYSVRYEGEITKDEIGVLAANFNDMVDIIQDNITSIRNYNFILKENIEHIKEYEEMRDSFVRNMTHELKTPLAVISSQVEMMHCTKSAEKRSFYYESAVEEIRNMSRLITDFLRISVAESSTLQTETGEVDITRKIYDLCEKMEPVMRAKKITFDYDIQKDCKILFSERHIEYIFNNYVMNAMRYVFECGKILVKLEKSKKGFVLNVYNDGENIPEEQTEKIWLEFYSARTDGTENTGLGLFIVKEIAKYHHMKCGVKNLPGGVEFWFEFLEGKKEETQSVC